MIIRTDHFLDVLTKVIHSYQQQISDIETEIEEVRGDTDNMKLELEKLRQKAAKLEKDNKDIIWRLNRVETVASRAQRGY